MDLFGKANFTLAYIYGTKEGTILFSFISYKDSPYDRTDDFNKVLTTLQVIPDETEVTETPTPTNTVSIGETNALKTAKNYLKVMNFSYKGLSDQLEYEGYSSEEITYAVDNCGADWYAQAVGSAKSYLKVSAFSYSGLIEQLEYEGYSTEEATYGTDNCGADWYEQAAKSAKSYLKVMPFSREELINQLVFEGFSYEQAEYGATSNGY